MRHMHPSWLFCHIKKTVCKPELEVLIVTQTSCFIEYGNEKICYENNFYYIKEFKYVVHNKTKCIILNLDNDTNKKHNDLKSILRAIIARYRTKLMQIG